jgi:glycerol uptake facilitator-like aquaporin
MTSAVTRAELESLSRRLAAEALGTALLLAAVVGSGIMAERLTRDVALALLCNTLATGAMLFVIIAVFAPLSGAHFNPAVTLVALLRRTMPPGRAGAYVLAQMIGAAAGVWLAHAMFGEALFALGVKARGGFGQMLSEAVATFGLILTIAGVSGRSRETIAAAVALYIVAAYWFTASTSFANPAVTLARALTPSFAGIRPGDAPGFIAAQLTGALLGWAPARYLFPLRTRLD